MGFNLKIEGNGSIVLGAEVIRMVHVDLGTPNGSKTKSAQGLATLRITGKLSADDKISPNSDTIKLFQWARVPVGSADAYRRVTVEIIAESQILRRVQLSHAFVLDYHEQYNDNAGIGEFNLVVRQKADKFYDVEAAGGLPTGSDR